MGPVSFSSLLSGAQVTYERCHSINQLYYWQCDLFDDSVGYMSVNLCGSECSILRDLEVITKEYMEISKLCRHRIGANEFVHCDLN